MEVGDINSQIATESQRILEWENEILSSKNVLVGHLMMK
jgi:hypothetical protein